MQNNQGGGGKKPDFIISEKRTSGNQDSFEIVGAGWKNQSKKGDTYISISMNNGAKFLMFKNTPKPKNTQQDGYQQSDYGQRQNQQPQHISEAIPQPVTDPRDIDF